MPKYQLRVGELALAISEGTAVKTLKARYGAELEELGLDFSRNWSYANRGANLANLEAAVRRRESPVYDSTTDLESILNVVQDMNVSNRVKNYTAIREGLSMISSSLEDYVIPELLLEALEMVYDKPAEADIGESIKKPVDYNTFRGEFGEEDKVVALTSAQSYLAWKGTSRKPTTTTRTAIAAGIGLAIALTPALAMSHVGNFVSCVGESIQTNLRLFSLTGDEPSSYPRRHFRLNTPEVDEGQQIFWPWAGEPYAQVAMHTLADDHDKPVTLADATYGLIAVPQKGNPPRVSEPIAVDSSWCSLPDLVIPGPKGQPICGGIKELTQYERRVALDKAVNASLGIVDEEIPDLTEHLVEVIPEEDDHVERFLDYWFRENPA